MIFGANKEKGDATNHFTREVGPANPRAMESYRAFQL